MWYAGHLPIFSVVEEGSFSHIRLQEKMDKFKLTQPLDVNFWNHEFRAGMGGGINRSFSSNSSFY